MNTSDSDRGTEGTAPRSNEQEPKENGYSVNPPPLVFHPSHSSFSFPEKRKKGRNEGISVLATLHTLNNNNRQLNTNISIVKETSSSRKSARIAQISSSKGRMPRYSPISSPSVASSSSASSPPRLNSPIPLQSASPLSPSPDVPPIPRSPNILPIPSPLTGLLIPFDLTMQDSILSLPLNESPKLVCCGKSIKHFPSKYIHRVRNLYTTYWSAVIESPHDVTLWHKAILLTMVLTVRGQSPGLKPFLEKVALLETDRWDKITFSLFVPSSSTGLFEPTSKSKDHRVSVLAKAGELSRALGTLLSDSTPSAVTPNILQSLEEKHPPRPSVIPDSLIPSDAFKTSQELFDISPIAAHSLIQKSSREIRVYAQPPALRCLRTLRKFFVRPPVFSTGPPLEDRRSFTVFKICDHRTES